MGWKGKYAGGLLGMIVGGPIGGLIGAALGDAKQEADRAAEQRRQKSQESDNEARSTTGTAGAPPSGRAEERSVHERTPPTYQSLETCPECNSRVFFSAGRTCPICGKSRA